MADVGQSDGLRRLPSISPSYSDSILNGAPFIELGEFVLQSLHEKELKLDPLDVKELTHILSAIKVGAKCVMQTLSKTCTFTVQNVETFQTDRIEDATELAHLHFINALVKRDVVAGISSQHTTEIVYGSNEKEYVVLINPLDGMQQIDVNVSVGTLFSVYKRISPSGSPVTTTDFLQIGKKQLCTGYLIYGSSTMLVYTMGNGVHGFTLDPITGTFYLSHRNIEFPTKGSIYSVNGGKYDRFPYGVRAYLDCCQNHGLSCRYIGSLVADFHRNMLKGGIFIYPPTFIDPRPSVSLVYQCIPLAFLAEQAGGKASDGFTNILDIKPHGLDDRLPFFCGSKMMVDTAEGFMAENKMRDGGWGFRLEQ
ncbi:fructose-bisphospatase I [Cardiosporidium cionae]|uniref:fructose-bisphosphatase n=1 Tax=Cardiosporidium cionae TaxID=476202 RepID=A0ABQ7J8I6_9APIC|nr:fructose-bisphospatase I [Cardiosporidium cionae]|eukprot:KAF8820303.1 fructose-bisphospatase I [Cardiosporidium cionae]